MMRQPQDFINVMATLTNQKSKRRGFKNDDQGQPVKHEFNEDIERILEYALDGDDLKDVYTTEKRTFKVWKEKDDGEEVIWAIQVPSPYQDAGFVNLVTCNYSEYAPDEMVQAVLDRMNALARSRDYPPGSVFVSPWGRFVITRNGTRPETGGGMG